MRFGRRSGEREIEAIRLAEEAAREQYQALRAEVLQCEQSLQQIANWSLATAVAVFAAALLFLGGSAGDLGLGTRETIAMYVFGFAHPGFLFASSLSWLGDAQRIASIGQYLRAHERDTARRMTALAKHAGLPVRVAPLRFENYRVVTDHPLGKAKSLPYIGTLAIYVGGELSGFVTYLLLTFRHEFAGAGAGWRRAAVIAWGFGAWPVLVAATLLFALRIRRHSADIADLRTVNVTFGLAPDSAGADWPTSVR